MDSSTNNKHKIKSKKFRKVSTWIKDAQYQIEHEDEIIKNIIKELHKLNTQNE